MWTTFTHTMWYFVLDYFLKNKKQSLSWSFINVLAILNRFYYLVEAYSYACTRWVPNMLTICTTQLLVVLYYIGFSYTPSVSVYKACDRATQRPRKNSTVLSQSIRSKSTWLSACNVVTSFLPSSPRYACSDHGSSVRDCSVPWPN